MISLRMTNIGAKFPDGLTQRFHVGVEYMGKAVMGLRLKGHQDTDDTKLHLNLTSDPKGSGGDC